MPLLRNEMANSKQRVSPASFTECSGSFSKELFLGMSVCECPVAWGESHSSAELCRNTPHTSRQGIFSGLELLLWCLLTPPSTAEQFHHWGGIVSAAG